MAEVRPAVRAAVDQFSAFIDDLTPTQAATCLTAMTVVMTKSVADGIDTAPLIPVQGLLCLRVEAALGRDRKQMDEFQARLLTLMATIAGHQS